MTCAEHRWTVPCLTCALAHRHETVRLDRIWSLGGIGHGANTQKPIAIRSRRRQLARSNPDHERCRVTVPDIDPVTRTATGHRKDYGYVDLPSALVDTHS